MTWKFGKYLQELMYEKGWKAADLARHSSLSHVYVRDLLRGETRQTGRPPKISVDILIALSDALKADITKLIDAYREKNTRVYFFR